VNNHVKVYHVTLADSNEGSDKRRIVKHALAIYRRYLEENHNWTSLTCRFWSIIGIRSRFNRAATLELNTDLNPTSSRLVLVLLRTPLLLICASPARSITTDNLRMITSELIHTCTSKLPRADLVLEQHVQFTIAASLGFR
jgi:hypothetical protein